jgi:hypothetical protein
LSLDERFLKIFEMRILQLIFGPVEEDGVWRRSYNKEIYELFKEPLSPKRTPLQIGLNC